MLDDRENKYRPLLEDDLPAFLDKVNTPWDRVPDLMEYNQHAYNRVVRTLKLLERERLAVQTDKATRANTQGLLILGEAGTGKTHLLMRVARNLAQTNHILFVNRPPNQHTVAQHVWLNVVNSLARSLPASGSSRSQLDDLLAHVFRDILVPEFERDIGENKDADKKRRWVQRLQADPYNLFTMLGEGEQRQRNLDQIRNRTLSHIRHNHPEVDPQIARALITYCLVASENRKRVLLDWLRGTELDPDEAKDLGLPPSWVSFDESSADSSVQKDREDRALKAIYSVATLSTHYQPLVLAFDQLEGLRGNEGLTLAWGDVVREIFTHAPNMLVVTCIFPSLWKDWFEQLLADRVEWKSVQERFAQQKVELDRFSAEHGVTLLASRLDSSFTKHGLPSNVYPFTEDDIQSLCSRSTSPREFLQSANELFQKWLDGDAAASTGPAAVVVTQDSIDALIRSTQVGYESEYRAGPPYVPNEQDLYGRIRNVLEIVLTLSDERVTFALATAGGKILPPSMILRGPGETAPLCLAVTNAEGNSLAACVKNLLGLIREGKQARRAVLLRCGTCKPAGKKTADNLAELERLGGVVLLAKSDETPGANELAVLNALYDTLVAIEERDLSIGNHCIDKRQFAQWVRTEGAARRSQYLRSAAVQFPPLERVLGARLMPDAHVDIRPRGPHPAPPNNGSERPPATTAKTAPSVAGVTGAGPSAPGSTPPVSGPPPSVLAADVIVGSRDNTGSQAGLLGVLKHDQQKVAVGFSKPMCARSSWGTWDRASLTPSAC